MTKILFRCSIFRKFVHQNKDVDFSFVSIIEKKLPHFFFINEKNMIKIQLIIIIFLLKN